VLLTETVSLQRDR
jgi:hypothetical protein